MKLQKYHKNQTKNYNIKNSNSTANFCAGCLLEFLCFCEHCHQNIVIQIKQKISRKHCAMAAGFSEPNKLE